MKPIKISAFFLFLLIAAIIANSVYIQKTTSELVKLLELADYASYEDLAETFKRRERFISLTVSHDDLTNIEEGFAELIGAVSANDEASLATIKSRLIDSLEHLGRLCGINIDSIL